MNSFPDLKTNDAILITGPTASGKSAKAIELARKHDGEVINADSMQVYDTLRVLTARPSDAEMEGVPHHLYGHVPAAAPYSTGEWLRQIASVLADLRSRDKVPIIIGGTGLYFKALTEGLAEMPDIPADLRQHWRKRHAEEGAPFLHGELSKRDPAAAAMLNLMDGQRLIRALEVLDASGRSILDFQRAAAPALIDPDRAMKMVVLPDRALLHERINRRFASMFEAGAVEEVEALLALGLPGSAPVMKAIGVPQIIEYLAGRLDRDAVIAKASAATRQYAKRQMTWFRNQMGDDWLRLI
ncbi:tRNA (adenosine(37)-N6)-dimethylallyltransferase MiaA [Rhizobium alvei]|uniref:tRNA dimethylallyltransferase n=1 Tax=Rhizobium alvei TaxID=1132659 RepID=A0ABT8YIB2_9HYPH|nr:tRNA (adenosine(37)-N6)-dimethylallyltransferase MiaA [Rhizobium alvei]MDO6963436.1 tRNA (adenosine(37)-N6)-dimethylallyltransferase MiaA [Rhizobium alvei]